MLQSENERVRYSNILGEIYLKAYENQILRSRR
jgi:hypothetical protein